MKQVHTELSYEVTDGDNQQKSCISVTGRVTRKASHQKLINIPLETKQKIEKLTTGGSESAVIATLLAFAVDELERTNKSIIAKVGNASL